MKKVALATSAKYSSLTDDDRLLVDPLADRGITAEAAVWDDPAYDWEDCSAVIIRSCWDYHLKTQQFLHWLGEREADARVLNSPQIIRWNADKIYLRELEAKGSAIVPTLWPEPDENVFITSLLRNAGWKKAVVKPRVSATAHQTVLTSAEEADAHQDLFDELRAGVGVMVQQYMETIVSDGEWSLMFFGGVFSHAVRKIPKPGDFRVQNDFGGTWQSCDPPEFVLRAAVGAVQAVDATIYARVDGVVEDGAFLLMELELIEPALFLGANSLAPVRFAQIIARQIGNPV